MKPFQRFEGNQSVQRKQVTVLQGVYKVLQFIERKKETILDLYTILLIFIFIKFAFSLGTLMYLKLKMASVKGWEGGKRP